MDVDRVLVGMVPALRDQLTAVMGQVVPADLTGAELVAVLAILRRVAERKAAGKAPVLTLL